MTITALIVDDEKPARERLTRLLKPLSEIKLIGEAGNAQEAITIIQNHKPQLIFLDISMPEVSGIELASRLRAENIDSHIIFTTAYDEYALDAFEVSASDYLLKPIRSERLKTAIRKIMPKPENRSITVKDGKASLKIALDSIIYLHSDMKYTEIHLAEKTYLSSESLKVFEETYPNEFMRIHRSTLINRQSLIGIEHHNSGLVALVKNSDKKLDISRRHQAEVRQFLKR